MKLIDLSECLTYSSQRQADRSIINGAKLINLPPEIPLFGKLKSWLETCSKQRSQYISDVAFY